MRFNLNRIYTFLFVAAFAGVASALETAPDYFLFKGAPGKKLAQTLTIKNSDAAPQRIALGFEPGKKTDASLIDFSRAEFDLKGGESKKITVTCRVPKAAGELCGHLQVRAVPLGETAYEVRLKPEVCVQVEGTLVSDVAFAGLSAARNDSGLQVEANLRNVGNMKVAPKLVAYLDGQMASDQGRVLSAQQTVFFPEDQAAFTGVLPSQVSGLAQPKYQRIFVTAFYRAADGQLMKKTESLIVEAKP